jgi:hypothetical protein
VILERHGLDLAKADTIRGALKKGDFGTAFGSVTPDMIEPFSIAGTPDMCNQKITRLLKSGITQFVVGNNTDIQFRKLALLKKGLVSTFFFLIVSQIKLKAKIRSEFEKQKTYNFPLAKHNLLI